MINEYSEFGGDFQLRLLALYVREPDQTLGVIEPRYFTSLDHTEIALAVKEAYKDKDVNSMRLTEASLYTLVWEQLRKRKVKYGLKPIYRKIVREIFHLNLSDRDILLEHARKFALDSKLRQAFVQAASDINSGNYNAVVGRFRDILSQEHNAKDRAPELPVHHLHRFIWEEDTVAEQENRLVYPIVPKRGGVLLYGLPKELKSWFGAALAIDASFGRRALKKATAKMPGQFPDRSHAALTLDADTKVIAPDGSITAICFVTQFRRSFTSSRMSY